uniref:GerMN domain-containing protein n=1 Tax=mine drainage metagenome TaxID=410659 RepID=E6Q4Q0_9ZZZZ
MSEIRRSGHRSAPKSRPNYAIPIVVLLLLAIGAGWWFMRPHAASPNTLTIYYTEMNGTTVKPWDVTLRPRPAGSTRAQWAHDRALYAALQAVVGPPADVRAVRFPPGTHVNDVAIHGSTVTVDLSKEVESQPGGTFGENAEFKSLVYSMTALPGISAVQITVEGVRLPTLPGGHLELDEPLHRSDF